MSNPVLVEVVRGGLVESRHRGAVAVADADGATVLALGDVARPVYPRSAVKPLQALPLLESGAAERYGFGDQEIALACASHGGEPAHVEVASRMLARAGLDAGALECGAHWPSHQPSSQALARSGGAPSALHNNCSGKHAGFLCVACAAGVEHRGYVKAEHVVQREVRGALEGLTGVGLSADAMRHRRLLDSDLGGAADGAGACLCEVRDGAGAWDRSAPRRRRASAPPARRSHITSRAPGASAPRS